MASVLNATRFLKNTATGNIAQTLQTIIDDLSTNQDGGSLMLDPVDASNAYQISEPVTCRNGVSIVGTPPTFNNPILVCPDLGPSLIGGTIFEASTSGFSCFVAEETDVANPSQANAVNNSPQLNLYGLGFKGFTDAIKMGAINRIGPSFGLWQHLFFEDDDGSGLALFNIQQMQFDHIKLSKTARGARFVTDHATCQPGNSIVNGYYCYTDFGSNPDYGLLIETNSRTGYQFAATNFMQFHRPQINCFGGDAGDNSNNANIILRGVQHGTGPEPVVNKCDFYGTDTEGEMDFNFNLTNAKNCYIKVAGSSTEGQVTTSLKTDNCDNTHIHSGEVDFTTDIDAGSSLVTGSGYFRRHKGRQPAGVYTVIDYGGTDNDVRTVYQPIMATESQGRNVSLNATNNTLLVTEGLGLAENQRTDNDGGTLSKDHFGIIEVGNIAAVAFDLPAAGTAMGGKFTFIKTTDNAFAITLNGLADGNNSEMDAQSDTITVRSNGTVWQILAKVIS